MIVPVHNMQGRLARLKSWVKEATGTNISIIMVLDGITDGTSLEIAQLEKELNSRFLQVLSTDVKSPGLARNLGISKVRTNWFLCADSDDYLVVQKLQKFIEFAVTEDSQIAIGGFERIDETHELKNTFLPPYPWSKDTQAHLAHNLGNWRILYKTDVFQQLKFKSNRMGEDYVYLNQAFQISEHICVFPEVVYQYYVNEPGSLTSSKKSISEIIYAEKELYCIAKNYGRYSNLHVTSYLRVSLTILKYLPSSVIVLKSIRMARIFLAHPLIFAKGVKFVAKEKCR